MSVVTPSYNQGPFIEETIRSVLLQGYPDLEYVVMDGGSADNSVEVIRKYEPWLAYWASETDEGQACAINSGWRRASGEMLSYLNSDDRLEPRSLETAVECLQATPIADLVYGDIDVIDAASQVIDRYPGRPFSREAVVLQAENPVTQPGFLMRRQLLDCVGWLDEDLHFAMDYDYWVRIALAGGLVRRVPMVIASFRRYAGSKSGRRQRLRIAELYRIHEKTFANPKLPGGYREQRDIAARALHLQAARYAYRAGDAEMTRRSAAKHLRHARLRSSPRAVVYIALSLLGDRGMVDAGRIYRWARGILGPWCAR